MKENILSIFICAIVLFFLIGGIIFTDYKNDVNKDILKTESADIEIKYNCGIQDTTVIYNGENYKLIKIK